jgi:hypothetical protein
MPIYPAAQQYSAKVRHKWEIFGLIVWPILVEAKLRIDCGRR